MLGDWGRPHNRDPNLNSQCEQPLGAPKCAELHAGVGSPQRRRVPKASSPTHPPGMPRGNLPIRTTVPVTAPRAVDPGRGPKGRPRRSRGRLPPLGNSLVWYLLGFPFGLLLFFCLFVF